MVEELHGPGTTFAPPYPKDDPLTESLKSGPAAPNPRDPKLEIPVPDAYDTDA